MEASSTSLIVKALDGLSARATVIAENIANANTPNYRPLRLSFEQALRNAAPAGDAAVAGVVPRIDAVPLAVAGGELRLDLEMAASSTTALRYSALIEVLSGQLALANLAIVGTN